MLPVLLLSSLFAFSQASTITSRTTIDGILLDPSLLIPGRSTCNILNDINPFVPLSCQNTTVQQNTCCFNAPGGHFLQTQFWDYDSPVDFAGPNNSWTIHGLWPNHCDGSFDQFCAPDREVSNITQILQFFGENEILDYMHTFWKDNTGHDETFWEHEFNKHATCMSTLEPQCIENFHDRNDVVIFVKRVISLFQILPTFKFLEAKGIVPSTTKTYAFSDVIAALKSATGKIPTVNCNGRNKQFLNEAWYHFETKGSVIDGIFVHADTDSDSSCADTVFFWPKGVPTPTPTATSTSSAPTPTSTEDKGTIQVFTSTGANVGCILSKGTWSQQTCATFRPTLGSTSGSIKFTSSKGLCAVDPNNATLSCGPDVGVASDFTNSTALMGSLLAFNGSSQFSSDVVPTGTVQSPVFVGGAHPQVLTLVYTRT
ncbi:ribonuclease T2 [Panus rudis PR-1116 ss-1]|nr:ribonuclease T2 [Panus rudis PR-1116 ss-1]